MIASRTKIWRGQAGSSPAVWALWGVYACFFSSGATSLVFEVLWSRQFVTIFGNSSYAVSIVLCAYMTGLGLGGWIGGRLADRIIRRMAAFGLVQLTLAVCALVLPWLLAWFRTLVPTFAALSPASLLVSTLMRFGLSFAALAVPCFLMGTTLPLLVRAITDSDRSISTRIGALYCWNTLGAAFGCLAAGFWMLDTFGLRMTNFVAAGMNVLVGLGAFALAKPLSSQTESVPTAMSYSGSAPPATKSDEPPPPGWLLLGIAFVNGLAGLVCEVLWFRYLAFLIERRAAYVFPMILCIYLLGLGLGGLIYSSLAKRIRFSARGLWFIQISLAVSVLVTFAIGALTFAAGPPRPLELTGMAWVTVFLPTVLMGMALPLLCNLYGQRMSQLGRRVGLLLAVNTAGTVLGSLLPIFVLVPLFGIQGSLLLASLLFGGIAAGLLAWQAQSSRRFSVPALAGYAGVVVLFLTVVPANLCQRVFLATGFYLAKHTDILFYKEGRTGTAIVTRDRLNQRKTVYINGNAEVPALYAHQLCFKMLGDLGPMLHPNPENVLMICLGGGIASGATTRLPDVGSLTVVDLESSVADAAGLMAEENNGLLRNPKTHLVIDDGRNYVATTPRRWPVIITDSTHPKAPDSWVLYSQEFYRQVRERLTNDGVFVQWVPTHGLSEAEYKIILRTFQSVFPHTSLWVNAGLDEQGQFILYSLLVSTPKTLSIDVARLRHRLDAELVRLDLEPYGLHTPAGFLDGFLCADDVLRQRVGDGPINTDDLPHSYYSTGYSGRSQAGLNEFFMKSMEDIWPYLTETGPEEAARLLHEELTARAKAGRLVLSGRMAEAYAMFPGDVRYRHMLRLYEGGPQYIDALVDTYKDNPQALIFFAGLRASGPGAFPAIKSIYERALEIDPENVDALSMLGGMRSDMGDLAGGEDYLRRAVRLDSESCDAHYNLGNVLFRQGNIDEAIICYKRTLKIVPEFAEVRYNLGAAFLQKGSVDEAINHFQEVLHIKPDNVGAQNILAWLLATSSQASLRDGNRAVELAERANRLTGGENPNILSTLAAAYAEAGQFNEALASVRRAMELAREAGQQDMVQQLDGALKLYEAGQPFREKSI